MQIIIVLPTYNEKDNIMNMLSAICAQQLNMLYDTLSILVVDDSSPDGTGTLVRTFMRLHPDANVHLLRGEKNGLGTAYIRGFKYAIQKLHADILFEMDADFSHDPADIPRMVRAIKAGSDFVIGSRYVTGGSIPKEWSTLRVLNSKFGNVFARYVTGLRKIHDCTSGFRAIRASLIQKLALDTLAVKGYVFQISLLHTAMKHKAVITEVPIAFKDRVMGESKIRFADITEFILNSFYLRFPTLKIASHILSILLIIAAVFSVGYLVVFMHIIVAKSLFELLFILISIVMLIQGVFTLFIMLYAWEDTDRVEANRAPTTYERPNLSFTALIPARNEAAVIQDTIMAVSNMQYPESLKQTIVICRYDDDETIKRAKELIGTLNKKNVELVIFYDLPVNKPHALNVGLERATNDVVVVFDAEDQPHANIYNIINTVMLEKDSDVVQSGVQLMNFNSRWFSALNVLEYFFWFKSSLHFFAKAGAIPLGGNTVFFKRKLLQKFQGWKEDCLTEDAEIGIRFSAGKAKVDVVYDERYVTQEETPIDIKSFIKQRTRWNQGFLQVLMLGEWKKLPRISQRILTLYVMLMPEIQAVFFVLVPVSIVLAFFIKLPVLLAMILLLPFYLVVIQIFTYCVGMYEFTKDYGQKFSPLLPLKIILTFYPFQVLLSISAIRSLIRSIFQVRGWEKTQHINAHRENIVTPSPYV